MSEKPEITYDRVGHWYGWNGGEYPVHPKTVVRVIHLDGGDYTDPAEKTWGWGVDGLEPEIVAFQIVRLYVPPPATVKRTVALYWHTPTATEMAVSKEHWFRWLRNDKSEWRCVSEPVEIEFTLLPGEQP